MHKRNINLEKKPFKSLNVRKHPANDDSNNRSKVTVPFNNLFKNNIIVRTSFLVYHFQPYGLQYNRLFTQTAIYILLYIIVTNSTYGRGNLKNYFIGFHEIGVNGFKQNGKKVFRIYLIVPKRISKTTKTRAKLYINYFIYITVVYTIVSYFF